MKQLAAHLPASRAMHEVWISMIGVAALLTIAHWIDLSPGRYDISPWPDTAMIGCVTPVVIAAGFYRPLVVALRSPAAQWLGKVSFGLYLVHEPLLNATRYALPTTHIGVVIVVAIPVSVGVAALFTRWVEGPPHRLACRAGAAVVGLRTSRDAAGGPMASARRP